MARREVPAHEIVRRLREVVITPEHAEREESEEFRRAKERLKADGHWRCWVCGSTENLQAHHYGCEWSLWEACDPAKLKAFLEEWDPYGYGRLLRRKLIESPDDIRNLLVLCQEHHTGGAVDGAANGIHEITFPVWIIQRLAKDGLDPVPQDSEPPGEVLRQLEKRPGGDEPGRAA